MPRHQFSREERQRGGFGEACRLGFQRTLERHPYYARKWLRRKLRDQRWVKEEQAQDEPTGSEKRD